MKATASRSDTSDTIVIASSSIRPNFPPTNIRNVPFTIHTAFRSASNGDTGLRAVADVSRERAVLCWRQQIQQRERNCDDETGVLTAGARVQTRYPGPEAARSTS